MHPSAATFAHRQQTWFARDTHQIERRYERPYTALMGGCVAAVQRAEAPQSTAVTQPSGVRPADRRWLLKLLFLGGPAAATVPAAARPQTSAPPRPPTPATVMPIVDGRSRHPDIVSLPGARTATGRGTSQFKGREQAGRDCGDAHWLGTHCVLGMVHLVGRIARGPESARSPGASVQASRSRVWGGYVRGSDEAHSLAVTGPT